MPRRPAVPAKANKKSVPAASAEKQMASFIAKFAPAVAKQIRACRALLCKRFPTAIQIVYDNYNFFVIGFATTERTSDALFALASDSKGVNLHFFWGSKLADPQKLLQGSGSQNRFLRLPNPERLSDPHVIALLNAAAAQAKHPLPLTGRGVTIIKSISPKPRPRR